MDAGREGTDRSILTLTMGFSVRGVNQPTIKLLRPWFSYDIEILSRTEKEFVMAQLLRMHSHSAWLLVAG